MIFWMVLFSKVQASHFHIFLEQESRTILTLLMILRNWELKWIILSSGCNIINYGLKIGTNKPGWVGSTSKPGRLPGLLICFWFFQPDRSDLYMSPSTKDENKLVWLNKRALIDKYLINLECIAKKGEDDNLYPVGPFSRHNFQYMSEKSVSSFRKSYHIFLPLWFNFWCYLV